MSRQNTGYVLPGKEGIRIYRIGVTVQEVCALAALTVIKHRFESKNPIGEADLE